MTLLEKVTDLVEHYQWDSGEAEKEARNIANSILAIPEIAEAMETQWKVEVARSLGGGIVFPVEN